MDNDKFEHLCKAIIWLNKSGLGREIKILPHNLGCKIRLYESSREIASATGDVFTALNMAVTQCKTIEESNIKIRLESLSKQKADAARQIVALQSKINRIDDEVVTLNKE